MCKTLLSVNTGLKADADHDCFIIHMCLLFPLCCLIKWYLKLFSTHPWNSCTPTQYTGVCTSIIIIYNTTGHKIIPSRLIEFWDRHRKMPCFLTTVFKTGWLRSRCQLNAWLRSHSTAPFPLWLQKEHLGLPTLWQMEEQPHAHSGLQPPLYGAKHNTNPRAGQCSCPALLSMNWHGWLQGFPWSWNLCPVWRFPLIYREWFSAGRALTDHRGVLIWYLCGNPPPIKHFYWNF